MFPTTLEINFALGRKVHKGFHGLNIIRIKTILLYQVVRLILSEAYDFNNIRGDFTVCERFT